MTAAAKPTTMTGRARHEVHPAALAFPEMPAAELEELADDIKQNGLAHPIVLSADGIILDGRNRLRACHRGVDSHNDSLSHNGAACGRLFRRRERDTALPSRASVVNAWFRGGRCLLAAPDRVRRWALQMMVGTATRQTVLQQAAAVRCHPDAARPVGRDIWRPARQRRTGVIRVLAVLIIIDLAALTLIGAAILLAWAGLQWLIGW